jgi:hypothetical protein
VQNAAEFAEVVDCSAAGRPDAQTRAPSTARLYGASQQCARPAHAPTCRPLVGRAIYCSHVDIPKGDFPEISVPSAPPPLAPQPTMAKIFRHGRGLMQPRGIWATCGAPNRPSTEKGAKFAPFSGHHATARQLSATTVACVALLRMRYRVRCGVYAYAARAFSRHAPSRA